MTSHHSESCELLAAVAAKQKGDPEWDRSERVSDVVDQVSQQRHRARRGEDQRLGDGCGGQDAKAESHRLDARTRTHDRASE